MDLDILWTGIIGLFAGWIAGQIMKDGEGSVFTDLVVGIIGSYPGGYLFSAVGFFPGGDLVGKLVVAVVGAVVLLFFLQAFRRR